MAKSVTLADIAAKVGVSSVAVYKALADKPGVSDKLRERIKQLADEMGYVSGAAEKAEAASKTGNIGIVIPEQYYGYSLGEEANNIFSSATGFGYNCSLFEKFDEAVLYTIDKAQSGDYVLLSPACSSFDEFSSYAERGERFKTLVLGSVK